MPCRTNCIAFIIRQFRALAIGGSPVISAADLIGLGCSMLDHEDGPIGSLLLVPADFYDGDPVELLIFIESDGTATVGVEQSNEDGDHYVSIDSFIAGSCDDLRILIAALNRGNANFRPLRSQGGKS